MQPSPAAELIKELLDENAELHILVQQETLEYLGEDGPPLDGYYWAVYHRILTQYLLEATHLLPIAME